MEAREVDVDGTLLAYRDVGRGDPLVLVHGNVSDMRSWEALEPLLAVHFRVINYSRRYAHPNAAPDRSVRDAFSQHVADLIALLEVLKLGKAHLVGNSSGAFVSLLVAQARPDLARTLTLEEPPVVSMFLQTLPPKPREVLALLVSSPLALLGLVKFAVGALEPATKAFEKGDDDAAVDAFTRGVLGDAAFAKLTPARRRQIMDNVRAHRATLLGAGLPRFTAADAASIRARTQLLHGADTPDFQRRINRRLAACIPGATDVSIPGASHFVHEDNPRAVADAIRAFCQAH